MRLFLAALLFLATTASAQTITTTSPDGAMRLTVTVSTTGALQYRVQYKGRDVIQPSSLSLRFKVPDLALDQFTLVQTDSTAYDQTWQPVWGEYGRIRDQHREVSLTLKDRKGSGFTLVTTFRVFNEGVAFRYRFPQQPGFRHLILADEASQFALTGDAKAFWIPGDYDTNEYKYNTTALSNVDAANPAFTETIHGQRFFDRNAVQTPLLLKTPGGLYISIHEAALLNYPAMNLVLDKSRFVLSSHLVPDAVGNKAYLITPVQSPWRTIIITDDARQLLGANRMILNLNDPPKAGDVSWIKPQKMIGVWWEMHVNRSSWDYGTPGPNGTLQPHGHHGANTANVKRYLDFAAQNGMDGVLVEGWNRGWEDWYGAWKEEVFDFVTPYPDYDLPELSRYAATKGVKLIMHHETSASVTNYERHLDTAYRLMKRFGMNTVKTGYVGRIIPRGEHHDGQWMVRHYERVLQKTAAYGIMVDAHEPVRPTGLHRTYPNFLACEAARGNEFNAWSSGNPPEHETILPFTRLMGGPMDYTPGIFKIKLNAYDSAKKEQVHTTLAKQLALYVTLYSPLQMAADLPENYEAHPDAFQFIKDVAVDWDDTRVLEAEPGDYLTVARQAKGTSNWFLGAITDEQARTMQAPLSFLPVGQTYVATIYRDGAGAHWQSAPEVYAIDKVLVTAQTVLKLWLAPGGGAAVSLVPATDAEVKKLKKYK